MKNRNSVYFRRLVLFYILISTVPILLLGIFSYTKFSDMSQQKVNSGNLQLLYQTQMTIEENLKLIQNYYTLIAYSHETTDIINERLDNKSIDSVLKIQEDLQGLMKIHTTIKSVYLISPRGGWFISSESAGQLDKLTNKNQILNIINRQRNIYWIYVPDLEGGDTSSNSINIGDIAIVIRFPFNQDLDKSAVIVSLSRYQFNKILNTRERTDRMLILDENNRVLYDDDGSMIGKNLEQYSFNITAVNKNKTNGFVESILDGQKVGVNYIRSSYNGWTYLSIYSIKQINEDSRTIGWTTLFLCLGIMGLSLGISTLGGTKVFYKPLKNIYESVKNEILINENEVNRDEMQYINKGINTLITHRNTMEKKMEAQRQQLEELFLIRLVHGELHEDAIDAKLKSLDISKDWVSISVMTIDIDNIDSNTETSDRRDIIMLEINSLLKEIIGKGIFLKPVFIGQVQLVLVKSSHVKAEETNNTIYEYAQLSQERIKENLGVVISFGISRPFVDLVNTQIGYKESLEALRGRIALGEGIILFFHEVQPEQHINQFYPKNMEKELIDAINGGDIEKSEEILDRIIDEILKEQLSFNEYQMSFYRLLIGIIRIFQDSGESLTSIFEDNRNIFEEMGRYNSADDIKRWFKEQIIHPVIAIRDERSRSTRKNILRDIVHIIETEYDTDLTIEKCAERVNYHPSYIWRIMKREMGISFSEYLSDYRLSMAKHWLRETEMPIYEIADRLKYNNSQNFIRYFKNLEGITPGQYRKNFTQKRRNL